ncbi:MAG TPA: hypothetical protein PLJ27_17695 [Polyangiaceae bacterium]|jgi:hypothetical protein|nr:MAG: hypothetical protein BWY17_00520 [Deltaproteobacteria bacterium ADurb.Bin207]HQK19300.1 hypothetical protein [Polyangiaceae bacterium]
MMTGRIVLPRLVLGAMGRRQRRWFWILGILIALISTAGAAAMGCAGAKPPSEFAQAEGSSSKQTSMTAEPSEATPFHATWQVGSCEVEMRQGLGSTYRFAEAQRSRVEQELQRSLSECMQKRGGVQGTLYVQAKVAESGALSEVVVSPGGAIPTDLVGCMSQSLDGLRLASPHEGGSSLMVFVVSACALP